MRSTARKTWQFFLTVSLIGTWSSLGHAQESRLEVSGYTSLENRVFINAPAYSEQNRTAVASSLVLSPEFRLSWNEGDDRLTVIPFARVDSVDNERSHGDIREFAWLHVGEDWDLRAGVDKVYWGVAESRQLVDIINQTDLVEDVDGKTKLGQAMANLGLQAGQGDINLFLLPRHRERTFPGHKGRMRSQIKVDSNQAVYTNGAGRSDLDFALRYTTVLGAWDVGLAHFQGTSREPRFVLGQDDTGALAYVPYYDAIKQTSVDVQATQGDWLWKVEALSRTGVGKTFGAYVAGFEYTKYGVLGSNSDLGFLAEYLYDGRDENAPPTSFEDDLFIGLRLTLNDSQNTNFLASMIIDHDDYGRFFSFKADRRLSENWKLEFEARTFVGLKRSYPSYDIRRDDHLRFKLTRFF